MAEHARDAATPIAAPHQRGAAAEPDRVRRGDGKDRDAARGRADAALRVRVVGGGCSGFQYNLGFDDTSRPDDVVIEQHGVRMLVDATSLQYLHGTIIDYVHGLHGAGFKFINPNANRTCGCGSSFSA